MQYLNEAHITIIRNELLDAIDPYLIMLFGSAAKEQMRRDSDVDIAYLSDVEINPYEQLLLAEHLANLLKRDVHLLNLNSVSTVLQAQVVGKGRIILDKEPQRRQEYFILVLKKYARLNEEREPVLARIKERSRVYVQ